MYSIALVELPGFSALSTDCSYFGVIFNGLLGHTNLILCCSGQKTIQAGLVGRLNNDNDSYMLSGCQLCVAEVRMRVFIVGLQH